MTDDELYERLRSIIRQFDSDTCILKASLSNTSYPDVYTSPAYCIINQNILSNKGPVQRNPNVEYDESNETYNTQTYLQRSVNVKFDFFGKDESETLDLANKFNQGLAYFLQEDPYEDMGLVGKVEPVVNNSDLLPNKDYKHLYTFRLKLFVKYNLTISENLITNIQGVEHKFIRR